jgi:TRAP transporter TAXI family solute receptor
MKFCIGNANAALRRSATLACAALTFTAGTAYAQQVAIGTSNPGSIYHSSGSVIAKLLNDKAHVRATIQPYASPNVFIPAVNSGQLPLGLANVAELRWAREGAEHFKGRKYADLRGVAIMYPLRSAVFVRKDSPIKRFADLKGHPVVAGFTSQKVILPLLEAMYAAVGLKPGDMQPVQVPNVVAGADAFAAGKTDMFFFALGSAKVREVDATVGGVRMLSIPDTPQAQAALRKYYPAGYLRPEKPGPGSIGVTEPGNSLAYDALVFGSTKTPDDVAYKVAKVMYESAGEMAKAFPPFALFNPKTMAKPESGIPYHPGALKFYKEVGLVK